MTYREVLAQRLQRTTDAFHETSKAMAEACRNAKESIERFAEAVDRMKKPSE